MHRRIFIPGEEAATSLAKSRAKRWLDQADVLFDPELEEEEIWNDERRKQTSFKAYAAGLVGVILLILGMLCLPVWSHLAR